MGCSLRGVERSVQACHVNHKRHKAFKKEEQSFFTFSCVGHTALTRNYSPAAADKQTCCKFGRRPSGGTSAFILRLIWVEYSSWNQWWRWEVEAKLVRSATAWQIQTINRGQRNWLARQMAIKNLKRTSHRCWHIHPMKMFFTSQEVGEDVFMNETRSDVKMPFYFKLI